MPRTEGVSARVERRFILLSPRPTSVARWLASRRIGLPVCSTVTVLSAIIPSSGVGASAVRVAAAGLKDADLEAAAGRDRTRRIFALQSVERGAHEVVRVGRAERLRHDVMDAESLEDGAHRAAGDDAGAGRGGAQDHL